MSQPPPVPPASIPPHQPQQQQVAYLQPGTPSGATSGLEDYNRIAETVGMMPTLRVKDNVIQALVVLAGIIVGAVVGYIIGEQDPRAAVLGGVAGLVLFGLISGFVLMILGWVRAARARRDRPLSR